MLDWEENLFVGLKALYRRAVVRPRERRLRAVEATLAERRRSLLVLAQLIAGRPLAIFETADAALCRDDRVFLPSAMTGGATREANGSWYEARAILAGLAVRDGWHRNGVPLSGLVSRYAEEFPRLGEKLAGIARALPPGTDLWTVLGALPEPVAIEAADATESTVVPLEDGAAEDVRVTTEIEGKSQAGVEVLPTTDGDGDGADLPMHTFEKVETVEEYRGQSRKSDAEDELDEHAEALRELTMTRVMRSAERPRSVYRGGLILDGAGFEVEDAGAATGVPYPEWDHRRQAYRRDWCFVKESRVPDPGANWADPVATRQRGLIRRLRRQFAAMTSEWLQVRRQPVGTEFDLDAVVDAEVARRSGHTPAEAVYLDRHRDVHDLAVYLVLDMSYSTDAWLQDRRVLDTIRESVFCVGEVLDGAVGHLAVAAFASNTRRSCEFNVVKDFDDPWVATRNRLGALEPRGYTRIGPALRHAQERLAAVPASRKAILLLTDGRPCDYDRYEGRYGIEDVKKAIHTGRRQGMSSHAFAIDSQAAEYFPQMFTQHHYDILPTPERLSRTLCKVFTRLLAA